VVAIVKERLMTVATIFLAGMACAFLFGLITSTITNIVTGVDSAIDVAKSFSGPLDFLEEPIDALYGFFKWILLSPLAVAALISIGLILLGLEVVWRS